MLKINVSSRWFSFSEHLGILAGQRRASEQDGPQSRHHSHIPRSLPHLHEVRTISDFSW
jgi:hypothetical protein